jgi:hypothetical protein
MSSHDRLTEEDEGNKDFVPSMFYCELLRLKSTIVELEKKLKGNRNAKRKKHLKSTFP